MRADGRRLGRIIGQLDDIQALLDYYGGEEPTSAPGGTTPVGDALGSAYHGLKQVRRDVQLAADLANAATRQKEG